MKLGYTTILHEPRLALKISCNEYCLADMVYNLSTNPNAPIKNWCSASQSMLGEAMGISRQSISTMIKKLAKIDILIKSENGKLLRCGDNWINTVVSFNFKCKQSLQDVKKPDSKESLHPVKNVDTDLSRKFTGDSKESLHNNNNNNNINNNIDKPLEIGGFKIELEPDLPSDVKESIIEYFNYRAALPKKDRIKTEFGVNKKLKAFSKILEKYSTTIFIKAIDLTISSEWKDVNVDWLFNKHPELRTKELPREEENTGNEDSAKTMFSLFSKVYIDIYTDRYIDKGDSVEMAGLRAKRDIEQMEPNPFDPEDTFTRKMEDLKTNFPNLYSRAYNEFKKL